MKKLIIMGMCLVLTSCAPDRGTNNGSGTSYKLSKKPFGFEVITIDGCEYIYRYLGYHDGGVLCHKGNCKNPIHRLSTQ